MNPETAYQLVALTGSFYEQVGASFSETRASAWEGWERVAADARRLQASRPGSELRVLDLACGNLRFERYLAEAGIPFEAWCADANAELMHRGLELSPKPIGQRLHTLQLDLLAAPGVDAQAADAQAAESMPKSQAAAPSADAQAAVPSAPAVPANPPVAPAAPASSLATALNLPQPCDLAACFGFLHHVPLPEQRVELLRALVASVRKGGLVVVSFWQFARNQKLLAKAERTTARAVVELGLPTLDQGDYLLGWQDTEGAYRYCHHFTEAEVTSLAAQVPAQEIARYSADGRTHNLNRYVVFQR